MARTGPRIFLPVIGLLLALAGCATMRFTPIPVVGDGFRIPPNFRIVGYFPSWSGEPANVQYQALTHINYAFLAVNKEGGYQAVPHPEKLDELVAVAHAYGVKVLVSLGGYNDGKTDAFEAVAASTTPLPWLMTTCWMASTSTGSIRASRQPTTMRLSCALLRHGSIRPASFSPPRSAQPIFTEVPSPTA